jgi:hypothetical protein
MTMIGQAPASARQVGELSHALLLSDEYHPTENPAGKWSRPETKARF